MILSLVAFVIYSPITLPLSHSCLDTLATWLFLENTRLTLISGLFNLLFLSLGLSYHYLQSLFHLFLYILAQMSSTLHPLFQIEIPIPGKPYNLISISALFQSTKFIIMYHYITYISLFIFFYWEIGSERERERERDWLILRNWFIWLRRLASPKFVG